MNDDIERYVIWSHEHKAWWRCDRMGYTENFNEAGLYSYDDACDITVRNIPAGEEVALLFTGDDPRNYIWGLRK